MKILLVDDKEENLYLLEKLLQGNGYETLSAANGAEALEVAIKNPPDMVVSDILMPVMDGFTLCREWRKNKMLKEIPFVFYTATYIDSKDEEFALSIGADRFVIKPQGLNDFLNIIKETFAHAQEKQSNSGSVPEEKVFLREYNQTLVRRLEEKMQRVEAIEKELREKNATLERDIEKQKQVEEALQASEEKFRTIFECNSSAIAIIESDTTISMVNNAYCQMSGYTNEQLVGTSWTNQISPDDVERLKEYSRRRLINSQNVPDKYEFKFQKKGGEMRYGLMSISLIHGTKKFITSFIDVTEQNKLQQKLIQSQKMESVGTLAGGIAHDFNNILGIILGYSSLIDQKKMSPEKLHESLGVINNAVGRGAALVRQILTFARKTDVVFEPMDITDLIRELISMLKQTFPKVINFLDMIDRDLPYIVADRSQIHQVLLNLCVNSRDAMPNGGTITVKAEKQSKNKVQGKIPVADHDSYICISVTDTGEGMSEVTRHQIFDPFFTTKEKGKGTGLGLAVVYGAVQSHHGFIDVESELGRGTTFRLYFPIPLTSKQSSGVSLIAESSVTGGRETILLVEDEEALKEMVQFLLESKGYQVITAQDGNETIKEYNQHKQEIDIVLTDMGLPGMTETDVLKKIKELNPKVNIIVASGFFEPKVKFELDKIGVKGFIQKPYSPDEVLRKLREVLDKNK